MFGRQWLAASEIDYCEACGSLEGLGPDETLIAWGPDAEIRGGDTVILEYDTRSGPRSAYLKAWCVAGVVMLRTRCGLPDLVVRRETQEASNGIVLARVTGIVRGTFLAF